VLFSSAYGQGLSAFLAKKKPWATMNDCSLTTVVMADARTVVLVSGVFHIGAALAGLPVNLNI
jgi:hypothetical protein